jgi:ATP-dependent Clp protease ATP-binding subunit ClpA
MGARPMARLIQDTIRKALADELLFGKLVNGGEVPVSLKDGAMAFELTPAPPKVVKKRVPKGAKPKAEPETSGDEAE